MAFSPGTITVSVPENLSNISPNYGVAPTKDNTKKTLFLAYSQAHHGYINSPTLLPLWRLMQLHSELINSLLR